MSDTPYGPLRLALLRGDEPLEMDGVPTDAVIRDFWAWSCSDFVDNTQRGVLAEWIVGLALGVDMRQPRVSWAPYDLLTPEGVRVEVKSAAFLQSWGQARLSRISFNHAPRRGFDTVSGVDELEPTHHADVWVFALLAHLDKATVNPLDLSQWEFYVVPTSTIRRRTRSQHSITLASLTGELDRRSVSWSELRAEVASAAQPETV